MTASSASPQEQQLVAITQQKAQLERLSILLDEAFIVPVIGVRIGWDAIIGLLPVIGDAAGAIISSYFVIKAIRFKLPMSTIVKMILNIGVEFVIGSLPLLGDLFDVAWRANRRNYCLVEGYFQEQERVLLAGLTRQDIAASTPGNIDSKEGGVIKAEVNKKSQSGLLPYLLMLVITLLFCSIIVYWGVSETGVVEQLLQQWQKIFPSQQG